MRDGDQTLNDPAHRPSAERAGQCVTSIPLSSGTTLGPYSVTGTIGEGGLGQVYCATDNGSRRCTESSRISSGWVALGFGRFTTACGERGPSAHGIR